MIDMPDRFDPYYKWLGIPAEEQPPHHYRLLGVPLFESDRDVINNAADQRMGLLKTFATGAHGSLSEELLNEVARARVCLLNLKRKNAYDDALRKKSLHNYLVEGLTKTAYDDALHKESIEIRRKFPQFAASNAPTIDDNGFHFDPQLTAPIPDVRIVPLCRNKKKPSPARSILGIIFGGVAGLSLAYLVLCLLDIRYDFLHLMSVERSTAFRASPDVKSKAIPRGAPTEEFQRPIVPPPLRRRSQPMPSASKPAPAQQPQAPVQPAKPAVVQQVPLKAPVAEIDQFEKPSAIVTLTLQKPVIRVIAETDKPSDVVCDVGFSHNLLHRGDGRDGYELVCQNLGHHAKETIELGAGIQGAGAAVEITFIRQNSAIVCELRPLFSLPSGDIQPLTISRGTIINNKLSKSSAGAKAARDSLPTMRSNLSQLQANLQSAQQAMNANGNTPAETGAGRTAAMIRATNLDRQATALRKNITAAEQLSAEESAINKDLQSLNEIAEYAKGIASISTISVRFHRGGITIPGNAK
jgi:hypothetical protein